jgi:hypothetical protein
MNNDVDKALGGAMQDIFHKLKERDAMNKRDIRNHALSEADKERAVAKARQFFALGAVMERLTKQTQANLEAGRIALPIDEGLRIFNSRLDELGGAPESLTDEDLEKVALLAILNLVQRTA